MTANGNTSDLLVGLRTALSAVGVVAELEPMADTGLAHAHFRLKGTGLIARVPKQSQMQLGAEQNLAYQASCYVRTSRSGHAPRLAQVVPPTTALPRGALVVEEISGRAPQLPEDLDAIVDALAAIHRLDVPVAQARTPLLDPLDPLDDLLSEISAQAEYLAPADIAPETESVIRGGIAQLRALARDEARPAKRLMSFDAHPGNFLLDAHGRAILVDLEKCRYSAPQLDLAHATLYTSTTWDVASQAVLSTDEVGSAHVRWLDRLGDTDWADAAAYWLVPMRRAMWLWSMTWCAKWRVLSGGSARGDGAGEDWSAEGSEAGLIDHVRGRVDHYLAPETATMVESEFETLSQMLSVCEDRDSRHV
jgi:hypothetical protein